MGSSLEVYNSWKQSRKFSYANVRKAAYRGSPTIIINKIFHMISVFKFCVVWGIFLTWFADSMLFTMMIKTEFRDPVTSIQELKDRSLNLRNSKIFIIQYSM